MRNLLLPGALLLCAIPQVVSSGQASRPADPTQAPDAPTLQTFKWSKGDGPVKMIRECDGFCFLSTIGGSFAGGGEQVEVYVDDGWWWLKGRCQQPSLWAKATCVTYGPAPSSEPAPRSKPAPRAREVTRL